MVNQSQQIQCNFKNKRQVFTENEKHKILAAVVKSFIETHKEVVLGENTTVSHTSEEDKLTREDQDFIEFSEQDDSEDESNKYIYENIIQKKCESDTDNEMENADDLETVDS